MTGHEDLNEGYDNLRIHVRCAPEAERKTFARGAKALWVRFKGLAEFGLDDCGDDFLPYMDLPVAALDTEIDCGIIRFPDVAKALRSRNGDTAQFEHIAQAYDDPGLVLVVPVERFDLIEPAAA